MNIVFLTNPVSGGWHPNDLETFLGGNEECLMLLARALARLGCYVEVYTTLRGERFTEAPGVSWRQREDFDPNERRDVFVSWKDRTVWDHPVAGRLKLHASQDVEAPLPLERIDAVLTLGTYHETRLPWLPPAKRLRMPLGLNRDLYRPKNTMREPIALYATSPDRGLEVLLRDWGRIAQYQRLERLIITYDWTRLATMAGPAGFLCAEMLSRAALQYGIVRRTVTQAEMVGLFQTAQYYIHPCPRPDADADLYGFGAMKAAQCGATLVLPDPLYGFQDTVREWIPYGAFIQGERRPKPNPDFCQPALSWDEIAEGHWRPWLERMP